MNIFKKGINLIKGFFNVDDKATVSQTRTSTPESITPTKMSQSMAFPVGQGLEDAVDVLPGPRISTVEAMERGEKINITNEPKRPEISQKSMAQAVVGKQPTKTLAESTKEIAKETGKSIISFTKKQAEEDWQRNPLQRLAYNLSIPYKVGKEVVKILPTIPGFIAREALSGAQSITKPGEQIEVPESLQFALGEDPIKSFQSRYEDANKTIKALGGTDDQARSLAVIGVSLSTWADLTFGGGKSAKEKIIKQIGDIVKDKATKEAIILEAERIAKLPKAEVQKAINTTIANILDDGSDAFKFTKEARDIADNTAKPIIKEELPSKIGSIGLNKFDVDDTTKQGIIKIFKDSGIEKKTPQTEKQWIKAAKESEVLQKAVTPEEVERANGMLIKTEQRIATIGKELQEATDPARRGELLRESIELSRVLNDELSARGRALRAAGTAVSEDATVMDQIIKDISKHTDDIDKIVEEGSKVDFNDAKAVADFYRKFVTPGFFDILTEFRYNNMLSNPRTQARNLMSNTLQTILVRPATKFVEAGIDTFTHLLTGKQQEAFFKDVPKYYYGLFKALPEAFSEFGATMRGERAIAQQDVKQALKNIPTGKLPGIMTIPSRTLESVDRMMQTLIIGGEVASGKTVKEAGKIAEYSLFRAGLDAWTTGKKVPEQGYILGAIDNVTSKIDGLRKIPGMSWFIPFLRTPMNFAKMWIEYSPAGLMTLPGSQRKKEQLAKALIGSTITAYGAQLAFEDRTTWGVPRDPEAKALFYASGKKPFSFKVGDDWVPMMYLGPLAFALALPAAIKYHNEDDPNALTNTAINKIGKDVAALAYFYSQQTFMSGLGSFVELFSGDPDVSVEKNLAFTVGQVIPFQGLVRYVSTIVDPVYRKANTFVDALESGIPYMSLDLEPHTLPTGEVSKRNKWSYLAPYDISQERSEYDALLKLRNQELQSNVIRNKYDKKTQKKALEIIDVLYNGKDDETIINTVKEMKDDTGLKSAVKNMIKKQSNYQAGLIQPYLILEPADRAELIHTKIIMSMQGGEKEEEELTNMLDDLNEAGLWGEKEREALKKLMKEYPVQ